MYCYVLVYKDALNTLLVAYSGCSLVHVPLLISDSVSEHAGPMPVYAPA